MSTITPTQDKSSTGQACSGRPINSTQGGKIRICNSDISEKYLHERCCGLESSRELSGDARSGTFELVIVYVRKPGGERRRERTFIFHPIGFARSLTPSLARSLVPIFVNLRALLFPLPCPGCMVSQACTYARTACVTRRHEIRRTY